MIKFCRCQKYPQFLYFVFGQSFFCLKKVAVYRVLTVFGWYYICYRFPKNYMNLISKVKADCTLH